MPSPSDSLQPHGLCPTSLPCPWHFPARILEWVPFPSPGHLPDPGIEHSLLHWQGDSSPPSHLGSPSGKQQWPRIGNRTSVHLYCFTGFCTFKNCRDFYFLTKNLFFFFLFSSRLGTPHSFCTWQISLSSACQYTIVFCSAFCLKTTASKQLKTHKDI